jgi:hypothetical protein
MLESRRFVMNFEILVATLATLAGSTFVLGQVDKQQDCCRDGSLATLYEPYDSRIEPLYLPKPVLPTEYSGKMLSWTPYQAHEGLLRSQFLVDLPSF